MRIYPKFNKICKQIKIKRKLIESFVKLINYLI